MTTLMPQLLPSEQIWNCPLLLCNTGSRFKVLDSILRVAELRSLACAQAARGQGERECVALSISSVEGRPCFPSRLTQWGFPNTLSLSDLIQPLGFKYCNILMALKFLFLANMSTELQTRMYRPTWCLHLEV